MKTTLGPLYDRRRKERGFYLVGTLRCGANCAVGCCTAGGSARFTRCDGVARRPYQRPCKRRKERGFLELDLVVALAILGMAIIPIAFSFAHEQKAFRADYCRAVANEIVDGEMEVLAAGDWKEFPDGSHLYMVHSGAAKNLPAGHFELTKTGKHLRLEWTPDARTGVGAVVREITVQ